MYTIVFSEETDCEKMLSAANRAAVLAVFVIYCISVYFAPVPPVSAFLKNGIFPEYEMPASDSTFSG